MDKVQILIITTVFAVICAVCGGIFYAAIPEDQDLFVEEEGKLVINEKAVEGAKQNIVDVIAPKYIISTPAPTPTTPPRVPAGVKYFAKHSSAPEKTLVQPDIPKIEVNFTNSSFVVANYVDLSSPPQGSAPLMVVFVYDERIPCTDLLWDFGEGFLSENPYVVHEYTESGLYRAFLTVNGANGTEKHYVNITVGV